MTMDSKSSSIIHPGKIFVKQKKQMMIIDELETNLKTSPSCGWIGSTSQLKIYCFAVFNDEQIYRIEHIDQRWSNWSRMAFEKIFIQRPLFLTSKPSDDTSSTQRFVFNLSFHPSFSFSLSYFSVVMS